ncbi:tRNA (adenosine(37)-N6)-threonylcarbamoyltransferase complex dimerization subunit type 1 TsaB [Pandoraea pneumonica]|uniref:tRNA (Adenosine(37)-N6)-threonylcarbamoyltransferase complex dimerization subunit type 1 TsaB n=1 Tax=Pandoraea pneumonica TaxID=2508299 RepID=A0A5E4SZN1_9BURK|nr:tRNA (adenosine(37)-N6)-threonylcarbamoyltransferase complex dimerization subunit type 1 TsaB [Pandoraea pneumonica]VVD81065.1 tRNA (adenosine(37)-N6)-threonylcarbamoyltransferase complex dimerization subunit type 1 TsaB [Pandoraea pneumonica]
MSSITLLALDTSTEFCSVAVYRHDPASDAPALVVERHLDTGPVSSTHILPAARDVLREAGLALADCDAIAFGAGPGSFTGLRTACGVAQGLAFGAGLPVVPVGTLLACAEAARAARVDTQRVLVALDARMNEAYWADYVWDDAAGDSGDWRESQAPSLDAAELVRAPDTPFVVAGNAAVAFGDRLIAAQQAQAVLADAMPRARYVATLAARAFARGEAIPADQAMPVYIRNKVAQTTAEREAIKQAAAQAGGKEAS